MTERITDFTKNLGGFREAVALTKEAKERSAEHQVEANRRFDKLKEVRREMLEQLLDERGLAVCSNRLGHHREGAPEEEKLGVFPTSQLRLLLRSRVVSTGSEYTESLKRKATLELLCPCHFPEEPNTVRPSREKIGGELDIASEIVERDGRLVTVVNSIDVTDLPVERYYSEAIYRHFELPELPELPRL